MAWELTCEMAWVRSVMIPEGAGWLAVGTGGGTDKGTDEETGWAAKQDGIGGTCCWRKACSKARDNGGGVAVWKGVPCANWKGVPTRAAGCW